MKPTSMPLYDAVKKYISDPYYKYCGESGSDRDRYLVELISNFLVKLGNGQLLAYGKNTETKKYELIDCDFWSYYGLQKSYTDFNFNEEGGLCDWLTITSDRGIKTPYHDVIITDVYERYSRDGKTSKQSIKGRKANTSWFEVAAIACRIIHCEGYTDTQVKFRELLEREIDNAEIMNPPGQDHLINLVRTIFKHRP